MSKYLSENFKVDIILFKYKKNLEWFKKNKAVDPKACALFDTMKETQVVCPVDMSLVDMMVIRKKMLFAYMDIIFNPVEKFNDEDVNSFFRLMVFEYTLDNVFKADSEKARL